MILVDTSVWVDFFNGHASPEAERLAAAIANKGSLVTCGVVIAELFQGWRKPTGHAALEAHFRTLPCLAPREPDTYFEAATLYRALRRRGVTVRSTIDCQIVRLAEEHGAALLARDRDMAQILASGLCRVAAA